MYINRTQKENYEIKAIMRKGDRKMTIKVSNYNEIGIKEVRRLIADGIIRGKQHIEQGDHDACAFAGMVTIGTDDIKLYAGDVVIANDDSYFNSVITIN